MRLHTSVRCYGRYSDKRILPYDRVHTEFLVYTGFRGLVALLASPYLSSRSDFAVVPLYMCETYSVQSLHPWSFLVADVP